MPRPISVVIAPVPLFLLSEEPITSYERNILHFKQKIIGNIMLFSRSAPAILMSLVPPLSLDSSDEHDVRRVNSSPDISLVILEYMQTIYEEFQSNIERINRQREISRDWQKTKPLYQEEINIRLGYKNFLELFNCTLEANEQQKKTLEIQNLIYKVDNDIKIILENVLPER